MLQFLVQPLRFVFQGACTVARFGIQRQPEQLVDGGDQAVVVARIHIEQIAVADDLIQARGALERAYFLEHALIVAGGAHAVDHQLFAAGGQAIHLHGRIHDGEKQRRSHDGEADQHQPAQ